MTGEEIPYGHGAPTLGLNVENAEQTAIAAQDVDSVGSRRYDGTGRQVGDKGSEFPPIKAVR